MYDIPNAVQDKPKRNFKRITGVSCGTLQEVLKSLLIKLPKSESYLKQ